MTGLDPQSQARLFYLLLLGMALLAGLFVRYRGRLGEGIQHAGVWVLIFLGVVIAYGFRDQLRDELAPAMMTEIDAQTIALRRQADGHFHATLEINGRDVEFLVDTGATHMVLSQRDARRVGLDPDRLVFSQPTMTANGRVFSAPVNLDRVVFGPFEDRNVSATVNGGALDVSLLGMRYLDRFRRVSVEGDRMVLER
jgi:aspartyl protease family protein